MKNENNLSPYFAMLKHQIRNKTVAGRIENVMEELGFVTKSGQVPVVIKKTKTSYGWYVAYHLPAGISCRDIEAKLHHFEEQAGGIIDLSSKGANIFFNIYTGQIDNVIPYEFEPEPKRKQVLLPIGYGLDSKLVTANFPDLPHLLVAGNTRTGKTNVIHVFTISLLKQHVVVCVVDHAKSEFSYLKKHAVVATEESETAQLLELLLKEAKARFQRLEEHNCFKWQDYPEDDMPYVVLIIDELGHLEDKETQHLLRKLSQVGAAAGISIILATQRPSATTFKNFTDVRALYPAALCFAVKDRTNSQIILDNDMAAKIPKKIKGRAIYQWDDEKMVQTMYLPSSQAREIVKGMPPLKGVDWVESRPVRLPPR